MTASRISDPPQARYRCQSTSNPSSSAAKPGGRCQTARTSWPSLRATQATKAERPLQFEANSEPDQPARRPRNMVVSPNWSAEANGERANAGQTGQPRNDYRELAGAVRKGARHAGSRPPQDAVSRRQPLARCARPDVADQDRRRVGCDLARASNARRARPSNWLQTRPAPDGAPQRAARRHRCDRGDLQL